MAITQTIEWTLEEAWISVLRASADLMALLGDDSDAVHREYDLSADTADLLPCVLVVCPGAKPELTRGEGYYDAIVWVTAVTGMDDDLTGTVRAHLAGAIRDVFEADGLEASLEAAVTGMKIFPRGGQQPDPPVIVDIPDGPRPTREFSFQFTFHVSMAPAIVNPET